MDKAKEFFWNDSIKLIEYLYRAELPYPLTSYFYLEGDIIVFDLEKELNNDVKQTIYLTFAIFN